MRKLFLYNSCNALYLSMIFIFLNKVGNYDLTEFGSQRTRINFMLMIIKFYLLLELSQVYILIIYIIVAEVYQEILIYYLMRAHIEAVHRNTYDAGVLARGLCILPVLLKSGLCLLILCYQVTGGLPCDLFQTRLTK